jgi:hypothetical protein
MKRYKHKPAFVDAQQWFPGVKIRGFCIEETFGATDSIRIGVICDTLVRDIHGMKPIVNEGEWIIQHFDGSFETMPNEEFQSKYEELEIHVPEC